MDTERNSQEWLNPDNWGGSKYSGLYFSKNDSRIMVPKRKPSMGRTINLGHRSASVWLFAIFGLFFVLGFMFGASLVYILGKTTMI